MIKVYRTASLGRVLIPPVGLWRGVVTPRGRSAYPPGFLGGLYRQADLHVSAHKAVTLVGQADVPGCTIRAMVAAVASGRRSYVLSRDYRNTGYPVAQSELPDNGPLVCYM